MDYIKKYKFGTDISYLFEKRFKNMKITKERWQQAQEFEKDEWETVPDVLYGMRRGIVAA
jgi:hypothetical protein